MNDKKLKKLMKYYGQKRVLHSSKEFEEETVIDGDWGLSDVHSIKVDFFLGIPYNKKSKQKFVSAMEEEDSGRNNLIGFKRGGE